jgi:hypothetical protein
MEKAFKKIIEQSKKSLEKAEEKIEDLSEDFNEEVSEVWGTLKERFGKVSEKLTDAYNEFGDNAELQAHLSLMEARDRLEKVKESAEHFAVHTSKKTKEEYDMVSLKAHLATMDAEDKWEETKKELSHQYAVSKAEAEKLSKKAGEEINEIFVKLTELV